MATKEIRSETWREMFFYTEADLAYFDEPRDSYYQFDPPNHLDDSHDNVEMMLGADGTAEPEDEVCSPHSTHISSETFISPSLLIVGPISIASLPSSRSLQFSPS